MTKRLFLFAFLLALVSVPASAQSKPVIVVGTFAIANGVSWPYDVKQLQAQTVVELKIKDGQNFDVTTEAPTQADVKAYALEGEVVEWHAGNKATRMVVGMGSGRETAKIHYWLTDASSGKK